MKSMLNGKSPRVFIVAVGYYPKYHQKSSELAARLAKKLSATACYLVWNNPEPLTAPTDCFDKVIVDDNRQWEFSAWESAREDIKNRFGINDSDIFVFLNDTVRFHRIFTAIDEFFFLRKINRIKKLHGQRAAITGEKLTPNKTFQLNDKTFDSWVSTYCFAANGNFVRRIGSLCFSPAELAGLIDSVDDQSIHFSAEVGLTLAQHINEWLFPSEGTHGWYKSKSVEKVPASLMKNKAYAILNEKRLSCGCQNMDGLLINIYESLPERKYRTWKDKRYKKRTAQK